MTFERLPSVALQGPHNGAATIVLTVCVLRCKVDFELLSSDGEASEVSVESAKESCNTCCAANVVLGN